MTHLLLLIGFAGSLALPLFLSLPCRFGLLALQALSCDLLVFSFTSSFGLLAFDSLFLGGSGGSFSPLLFNSFLLGFTCGFGPISFDALLFGFSRNLSKFTV
ncbi:MAG: hypothetical protein ACJ746_02665 [Bryobacteraceae bacterium]